MADKTIPEAFRALGYRIFRLLPGAPLLVPVGPEDSIETFELNLFAAKPDRAAALAREGWLAEELCAWTSDESQRAHALDLLAAQTFWPALARLPAPAFGSPYRDALAGYALWRSQSASPSLRYAALRFSHAVLRDLCQTGAQAARLSSLARVAWELGERDASLAVLQTILALGREKTELAEPFWPVNARFDAIAPGAHAGQWFLVSVLEQLERATAHSSAFMGDGVNLDWLRRQPFVSTQIERRHALKQMRAGIRIAAPEKLCRPAEDHLNADLWRSGSIPNTLPSL